MRVIAGSPVKLIGVLEAMGMALPKARKGPAVANVLITDTRLPVGFADDEFDDSYEDTFSEDVRQWIDPGPDKTALAVDVAVVEQRQPLAEAPVRTPAAAEAPARNQGAWARAYTEPHILHRSTRRGNSRVRSYSVAYYRSEHARATGTGGGAPVIEAPRIEHRTSGERRAVDHFDAMGYRGRHRWFKG